jgi:hypothetical protein
VSIISILGPASGSQWSAQVAHSSLWLSLRESSGLTPDSLPVEMNPAGLGVGTYQDTILFSVALDSVSLPVEFRIQP